VEELAKALLNGVILPILTAIVAAWWKSLAKPAHVASEDRLLVFELLVAAFALVLLNFVGTWVDPTGTKNALGFEGSLTLAVLIFTLAVARRVKRMYIENDSLYVFAILEQQPRCPVYEISEGQAVALSIAGGAFLFGVFVVERFGLLLLSQGVPP
jgi:hypothetical protein